MLMGATLPAMSRWVETTPQGVSWLGFFYGGNIGGAVIGSLLAGFYLLRVHDMATATYRRRGAQRRCRGGRPGDLPARAPRTRRRDASAATRVEARRPARGRSTWRSRSPA